MLPPPHLTTWLSTINLRFNVIKRLRNLYRRALSTELGVVGDEILQVQDTVEALIERFDRLQARIGMRQMRQERAAAPQMGDPLEERLRRAAANEDVPRGKSNGELWPDVE